MPSVTLEQIKSETMSDTVKVWDPLVRLFHWTLVIAVSVAYFTQEQHYERHLLSGYIVLGLVLFRALWGLIGSRHARFTDFVYPPATTLSYLRDLVYRKAPRYLGHNPAGGWMIIALLSCLLCLTLSGIALDAAENRAGPLASTRLFLYTDTIMAVHEYTTWILLALVALHVLGTVLSSLLHRENLVVAMINGNKRS